MAITLTVEDGTGLAGANTYASQADADAYFANRLNTTWAAATSDAKAAALIQATQYLDARYAFKGVPLTTTQALAWPRTAPPQEVQIGFVVEVFAGDASLSDQLAWPVQRVKDATCEAAARALASKLYTDEDPRVVTSEQVDTLRVTYAAQAKNGGQTRFAIIDDLLKPYTVGNRYSIAVQRA